MAGTAGSYFSASDRRVHFGLGQDRAVKLLEISWPSGATQKLENLGRNRIAPHSRNLRKGVRSDSPPLIIFPVRPIIWVSYHARFIPFSFTNRNGFILIAAAVIVWPGSFDCTVQFITDEYAVRMTSIFRVWRGPCLRSAACTFTFIGLSIRIGSAADAGIIAGSVLDASGAGVDGATVTATNTGTGGV